MSSTSRVSYGRENCGSSGFFWRIFVVHRIENMPMT